MRRFAGAWVGAAVLVCSSAFAQVPSSAARAPEAQPGATVLPAEPDRRWSVSVDLLGLSFGQEHGLEAAMRSARFDDTLNAFGTLIRHPFSGQSCALLLFRHGCEGNLPAFEVERHLKAPWSMALLFSRTALGDTEGYHAATLQFLGVAHRVDSFGALLSVGNRAGEIGIGPAVHVAQVRESGQIVKPWTDHTKVGFMARARAALPARSRVFLDLRAEYHFTGSVPIGPYEPSALPNASPLTFPATRVAFNYWLVGIGPGVRF